MDNNSEPDNNIGQGNGLDNNTMQDGTSTQSESANNVATPMNNTTSANNTATPADNPVTPTNNPAVSTNNPAAPTNDPAAPTNDPAVSTNNPTVTNVDTSSKAPVASTPTPTSQKKPNGTLITIVIAMAVVLVAVITTLVIVLINNNSPKSQRGSSSHYEEDDDPNDIGDLDNPDDGNGGANGVGSISCLGYRFEKQPEYSYKCDDDALQVGNLVFFMYAELLDNVSYYQAENHIGDLATQFSQSVIVNSNRKYTASNGKKMIVFDVDKNGTGMYIIVTAASSSSVLVIQVVNDSGKPTTTDLETVADLLSNSTISSRLPEDESNKNTDMPTIDWSHYLNMPELQKQ